MGRINLKPGKGSGRCGSTTWSPQEAARERFSRRGSDMTDQLQGSWHVPRDPHYARFSSQVASKKNVYATNSYSLKGIYLQAAHTILYVCSASPQCDHTSECNTKANYAFPRIKAFNRKLQSICSAVKHGTCAQWPSSFLRKVTFSRGLGKSIYKNFEKQILGEAADCRNKPAAACFWKEGRKGTEGGKEEKEHPLSLRPSRNWRGRMLLLVNLAF